MKAEQARELSRVAAQRVDLLNSAASDARRTLQAQLGSVASLTAEAGVVAAAEGAASDRTGSALERLKRGEAEAAILSQRLDALRKRITEASDRASSLRLSVPDENTCLEQVASKLVDAGRARATANAALNAAKASDDALAGHLAASQRASADAALATGTEIRAAKKEAAQVASAAAAFARAASVAKLVEATAAQATLDAITTEAGRLEALCRPPAQLAAAVKANASSPVAVAATGTPSAASGPAAAASVAVAATGAASATASQSTGPVSTSVTTPAAAAASGGGQAHSGQRQLRKRKNRSASLRPPAAGTAGAGVVLPPATATTTSATGATGAPAGQQQPAGQQDPFAGVPATVKPTVLNDGRDTVIMVPQGALSRQLPLPPACVNCAHTGVTDAPGTASGPVTLASQNPASTLPASGASTSSSTTGSPAGGDGGLKVAVVKSADWNPVFLRGQL